MLNKWKGSSTMKGQIRIGLRSVALVLATLILVTSAKAKPRHECTQDDLEGAYGYVVTGPLVGVGPVASVGLATFDGVGGLRAKDTVSTNGSIVRRTGRGSYMVNANCTGSAKIGDDFMFDFMIIPDSGGREFSFTVTKSRHRSKRCRVEDWGRRMQRFQLEGNLSSAWSGNEHRCRFDRRSRFQSSGWGWQPYPSGGHIQQ